MVVDWNQRDRMSSFYDGVLWEGKIELPNKLGNNDLSLQDSEKIIRFLVSQIRRALSYANLHLVYRIVPVSNIQREARI